MTDQPKKDGLSKTALILIIVAVVVCLGTVSVFFIGIVAAIALPNFIGAQDKARCASVKANMRTAQIVAESYAVEHGGMYPKAVDDLKKLYPSSEPPVNPFTAEAEWPQIGSVKDPESARALDPEQQKIGVGVVEYSVVMDETNHPTSYAIRGGDKDGHAIEGKTAGSSLVLSNH